MELVDLAGQPAGTREQAAGLLHDAFNQPTGWPSLAAAAQMMSTSHGVDIASRSMVRFVCPIMSIRIMALIDFSVLP